MSISNDVLPTEILRHGAYLCLKGAANAHDVHVAALATRLGFQNEFEPGGGHPTKAVAFLRRMDATPGDIADEDLFAAETIIHVAAPNVSDVDQFCHELRLRIGSGVASKILRGVIRPPSYTGNAMHNFAYAHQVVQQPGTVMPHVFLVPMSKTPVWWAKNWLERHTYFLPRYDDAGRMVNKGHALAAAAGISCLLRRTYRSETVPAPEGTYDFLNYFECADVPCSLCRPSRREEKPGVEIRTRRSRMARPPSRDVAEPL